MHELPYILHWNSLKQQKEKIFDDEFWLQGLKESEVMWCYVKVS